MLRFRCPKCGQTYQGNDYLVGAEFKCTHCKAAFKVPDPAAAEWTVPNGLFFGIVGISAVILLASVVTMMVSGPRPSKPVSHVAITPSENTVVRETPAPPAEPVRPAVIPTPAPTPSPAPTPDVTPVSPRPTPAPAPRPPTPTVAVPTVPKPPAAGEKTSTTPIVVWDFRYVDTGGNTQGREVANGQAMAADDLLNSAPAAAAKPANTLFKTPSYATYSVTGEDLASRPGADGFAIDVTNGHPLIPSGSGELAKKLTSNTSFTVWVRVKRTAPGGAKLEAIVKRNANWRVGLSDGKIDFTFGGRSFVSTQTFPVGQWRDIAVVYDDKTKQVKLYVEGDAAGSTLSGKLPDQSSSAFEIGSGPGGTQPFAGLFDRVMFWDRAVDDQTIRNLTVAPH